MTRYLLILFFALTSLGLQGQDRHFSQFYSAPLNLNPALTGGFDAKYRIGLINRDQWRSVLEHPYKTFAATLEVKFGLNEVFKLLAKDKIAVGLMFFSDKVEGVEFNTNQMSLSLAYHKVMDKAGKSYLTLGFQAGLAQRNINFLDLFFDDQFNEIDAFDLPTNENLPGNNFSYGDYAIGLNYTTKLTKKWRLFAGGAMHHIFEPRVSFYEDNEDNRLDVFLQRTYTGHAGFNWLAADGITLSPRILFMNQGPHLEVSAGSNVRLSLSAYDGTALHIGAFARTARDVVNTFGFDALVGMVGIEAGGFLLGLSYDVNLRALANYSSAQGAFEISAAYLGEYENETILCPKF